MEALCSGPVGSDEANTEQENSVRNMLRQLCIGPTVSADWKRLAGFAINGNI